MSTHTPGPWIVNAEQVFGNGHKIATLNQHTNYWLEDRALIEAAPDLLAALREIDTIVNESAGECRKRMGTRLGNIMVAARAAIQKAEGNG